MSSVVLKMELCCAFAVAMPVIGSGCLSRASASSAARPKRLAAAVMSSRARAIPQPPGRVPAADAATPPEAPSSPRYACPTCRTPVRPVTEKRCPTCATEFPVSQGFLEMLPKRDRVLSLLPAPFVALFEPLRQSLFQNPLVSFSYERGWRDSFEGQGFPGPDAEYSIMERFFLGSDSSSESDTGRREGQAGQAKTAGGDTIALDVSCGSGLMARRMVSGGRLGRVIAVDYSASMLQETIRRAEGAQMQLDTVRADVARLPFETCSIDYAHAGAAVHCWPKPLDGLAEVCRVLKPGGRFLATTFLKDAFPPPRWAQGIVGRSVSQPAFRFFDRDELRRLFQAAGFTKIDVEIVNKCAIVRCEKAL
jgi:SAM-dependent methyltransferase